MALDFPSGPTNGQTYTSGGLTWTWNSTSSTWESTNNLNTVTASLGSASAPSYTFTGDTNTGMFSPAADTLAFVEGGSEVMRITSAGNLAVGTTTSTARFEVVGPTLTPATHSTYAVWLANAGGANGDLAFGSNTSYSYIQSFNSKPLYLNSLGNNILTGAGNLGVGTTSASDKLTVVGTVSFSGALTSGDLADAVGYKGLPQNSKTSSYTLALSDMGKHISITTGGVVIPANSSVAFPIGATVVIYNNSASTQNLSITTDTLRLAGTATSGTRTIAQRGLATCVKVGTTEWVVSGSVT